MGSFSLSWQAGQTPTIGKVREAREVAELALDQLAGGVEPVRRRTPRSAPQRSQVTNSTRRAGERVAPGAVAEVHVADEPDLLEHDEVAVDRREVGTRAAARRAPRR